MPLSNSPRDYAWGSTTLLAGLEGRPAGPGPEAEVWFGDHPADPALTPDGQPLGDWLAAHGAQRLTYLLKLLAAASPLSIQAHPSLAQARAGFAREEAAGIPRDAAERTYRDENHKPELIVALSDEFTALAGLRPLDETRRLLAAIGPAAAPVADRLAGADEPAAVRETIGWVLSPDAQTTVDAVLAALPAARSDEFSAELEGARRIAAEFPGDPGVVVALLMNRVTLRRGQGMFLPAGVLHAYLEGLGVELMAASDNVLRGGLTPKHIDVAELMTIVEPSAARVALLEAEPVAPGVRAYRVDVPDFSLRVASPSAPDSVTAALAGATIVLATRGIVTVAAAATGATVQLRPGQAVLATADEESVTLTGDGDVFIAGSGR